MPWTPDTSPSWKPDTSSSSKPISSKDYYQSFCIKTATEIGLKEAIVLYKLGEMINSSNTRRDDGVPYVETSVRDLENALPYLKRGAIRRTLKRLEKDNRIRYDRGRGSGKSRISLMLHHMTKEMMKKSA